MDPRRAETIAALLQAGMQAVLCRDNKRPLQSGWPRRWPGLEAVQDHDGPVALVPASLGLMVFDQDKGSSREVFRFLERYPPVAVTPSRQSGRHHIYYLYWDGDPAPDGRFEAGGVSGEIKCCTGYVILWGDNAERLRDAICLYDGSAGPAPLHLRVARKRSAAAPEAPAPEPARPKPLPAPMGDPGSPGQCLFHALRWWAYRAWGCGASDNPAAWPDLVLDEARRIARDRGLAISDREVELRAKYVAEWVATHLRGSSGSSRRSENARQAGLKAGEARRLGTPLEHDREPWVALGVSQRSYYRYERYGIPRRTPQPWQALGIGDRAWRKRRQKVLSGNYDGDPVAYLGITQEEWEYYYAGQRGDVGCNIGGEAAELALAGDGDPDDGACEMLPDDADASVPVGALCCKNSSRAAGAPSPLLDPVASAVALMEQVAAAQVPPAADRTTRSRKVQGPMRGVQRALNLEFQKARTRLRNAVLKPAEEAAMLEFLRQCQAPYDALMRQLGRPRVLLVSQPERVVGYQWANSADRQSYARDRSWCRRRNWEKAWALLDWLEDHGWYHGPAPWEIARREAMAWLGIETCDYRAPTGAPWTAAARDIRRVLDKWRRRWQGIDWVRDWRLAGVASSFGTELGRAA